MVALRVLDPILPATKTYAVEETGGQTERGTDRDGTHTWSLGQGGEISKAGGPVGAGWREQDLPGCAEAGWVRWNLQKALSRCLSALGLPHLLFQEPLPFYTHYGDNAAQEDLE